MKTKLPKVLKKMRYTKPPCGAGDSAGIKAMYWLNCCSACKRKNQKRCGIRNVTSDSIVITNCAGDIVWQFDRDSERACNA